MEKQIPPYTANKLYNLLIGSQRILPLPMIPIYNLPQIYVNRNETNTAHRKLTASIQQSIQ